MADNLDSPSFEFGIQNTMEMGIGNPELLNDLMSPETSTTDLDALEPITKEVTPPTIATKDDKSVKGKEVIQKVEGEETTDQDILKNFLQDGEESEEEEEIKEETSSVSKNEEEEDVPATQFTLLARDLFKLGVFTKDNDEEDVIINSPEELLERFNAEKTKGAIERVDNFLGQFGEDYQNAFDAIFVKGVNPKEYFGIYNQVVDFVNLDLSVEENQIAVIRQSLTDQEMEPEDITTEIERLKNYGDLESVAGKHHKVLVKRQAVKLQQVEAKAQADLQQKQNIKSQYIANVQQVLQEKLKAKEFDGIPLNPKLVNELQDFLLIDKYKTASGETLTDFDRAVLELKRPENHAQKVKIALLFKILEKDPTLSTIQRSGVTKKSDQLFGELARQTSFVKSPKPTSQTSSGSWFQK
jgi:hypothetical protein